MASRIRTGPAAGRTPGRRRPSGSASPAQAAGAAVVGIGPRRVLDHGPDLGQGPPAGPVRPQHHQPLRQGDHRPPHPPRPGPPRPGRRPAPALPAAAARRRAGQGQQRRRRPAAPARAGSRGAARAGRAGSRTPPTGRRRCSRRAAAPAGAAPAAARRRTNAGQPPTTTQAATHTGAASSDTSREPLRRPTATPTHPASTTASAPSASSRRSGRPRPPRTAETARAAANATANAPAATAATRGQPRPPQRQGAVGVTASRSAAPVSPVPQSQPGPGQQRPAAEQVAGLVAVAGRRADSAGQCVNGSWVTISKAMASTNPIHSSGDRARWRSLDPGQGAGHGRCPGSSAAGRVPARSRSQTRRQLGADLGGVAASAMARATSADAPRRHEERGAVALERPLDLLAGDQAAGQQRPQAHGVGGVGGVVIAVPVVDPRPAPCSAQRR